MFSLRTPVRRDSYYLNSRSVTETETRVLDTCPQSGLCPLCIRECQLLCEVGLSAFRGREALYPVPRRFGESTAAAVKDFRLDWSHFNINSELLGADGIEASPDEALFTNVNVESEVGGIKLKLPIVLGAFGSTDVARVNWDGLAIGAALSGLMITIGENVCGMDMAATFTNGKVTYSKEMERRINSFRRFWDGVHGEVAVQTNVEDQRMGVDQYVISKHEVNVIERKWGQGAKAIGGEVRVKDLWKALELKHRGYLVIPDPEDKRVQEAFKSGAIDSFERHSRVGMPNQKDFVEDVEWLRQLGAKHVGLKTGSYRPSAVAFTMKVASEAKLDYVCFDGSGGGTGMSPVTMMDEMGLPTVHLEAIVLRCAEILKKKGRYVPDIVMAGGFINESQIYKAIALSNFGDEPYVKAVLMARAPLTAVMKSSYFAELAKEGKLPHYFKDRYGDRPEQFFSGYAELSAKYNGNGTLNEIPWEAIGLYTYLTHRIGVGLQHLMAGSRKWRINLINRSNLVALTEFASRTTGIPLPEELDQQVIEQMLS
ncbi:MAG: glutamate synthase-related protein [Nitrososphaerales archaeon]